ncbi:CBASS cGAMP-activated phospholipase [Bacillus sp. PS06]|uniref:CBASS cGAMP-activated phospholipase n=1 Tax=Bacillus sp. PS06 TaxID=2764176 RepID=UPI001CD90CD4|nr:CBASS cGAMP-activated phospholipase [Bacillus sp. PS06]
MLCIDGGGIRGVFAISILKEIEQEFKKPIVELFDVIAGTSTGAIVAASIIMNNKMTDVLNLYRKNGAKIFIPKAKIGLFKSVYSDEYLRSYLQDAFGHITLKDIRKPLLIPAVNVTKGRPYIHRSNYGHHLSKDMDVKLWDAVLSSCSAPVYFPPNNIDNKYLSIDGGLWANNPSMVCITEALSHFNKELSDIQIMSVGTGLQNIDFTIDDNKYWGVKKWLPFQLSSMKVTPKLIDLALNLSSESVSFHCSQLLKSNYLRINQDLGKEVPFDDITSIGSLIELGQKVFQEQKSEITHFFNEKL